MSNEQNDKQSTEIGGADEAIQRLRDMQYQDHCEQQWKDEVWSRVEMLMRRVDELEARLVISHGG